MHTASTWAMIPMFLMSASEASGLRLDRLVENNLWREEAVTAHQSSAGAR